MALEQLDTMLSQHQVAVVTTYRRDGRPQMSLVTVGRFEDGIAFTTTRSRAKYKNLVRDPRCALMLTTPDWRGYAVLDGDAEVRGPDNTQREKLRDDLRAVYAAAAGKEHPNWDEYDAAMLEQERVVVLLRGRLVTVNVPA